MSKINWPPEKTMKYKFKTKEEIEKDYMEIPLVDGNKEINKDGTKTERE